MNDIVDYCINKTERGREREREEARERERKMLLKYSILLGYYAVTLGLKFPTFRRIIMPSSGTGFPALNMSAIRSFVPSVPIYLATQQNIPEDWNSHHPSNKKPYL